jgi:hypothetical protein
MGIDAAIRAEVLPRAAPGCHKLFSGTPVCVTRDTVLIRDLTALLYTLSKPSHDGGDDKYMVTLTELYDLFRKLVFDNCRVRSATSALEAEPQHVKRLILCRDKPSFLPPRQKYNRPKVNPYFPGSTLGWEGLKQPDKPQPEKIHIRRLTQTGALANKAIQLMVSMLEQTYHAEAFPCPVIFDYEQQPRIAVPVEFLPDGSIKQHPEWANQIGETDLSINAWVEIFRADDICVMHKDSDQIPIACEYLLERPPDRYPKSWMWVATIPYTDERGQFKHGEVYDLLQMYQLIRANDRFFAGLSLNPRLEAVSIPPQRVQAFIDLCKLCGTDWTSKKHISHEFGWKAIWYALKRSWRLWQVQHVMWAWLALYGQHVLARDEPYASKIKDATRNDQRLIDTFVRWEYDYQIQTRVDKKRKIDSVDTTVRYNPVSSYLQEPPTVARIRRYMIDNRLSKWDDGIMDQVAVAANQDEALNDIKFLAAYWKFGWRPQDMRRIPQQPAPAERADEKKEV